MRIAQCRKHKRGGTLVPEDKAIVVMEQPRAKAPQQQVENRLNSGEKQPRRKKVTMVDDRVSENSNFSTRPLVGE